MAETLQVNERCAIPLDELTWRFTPSGGPGGQHANRSSTRVEVVFDVASSPTLSEDQRRRLLAKLGPTVTVTVDDERSQLRNRRIALQRLAARLAAALFEPRPRRATRPTRGGVARRLADKRQRSELKRLRRAGDD